jgi:erythromycin esterase
VTEKGFTAFAIEASMPEAFDVDAYVLGGPGDSTKALDALYFWTINTEEVADLIEWMRAYNLDPAHTRKVHFYGFDVQSPARAAKRALAYVRKVDPAYGAKAGAALARAADALLATDWSSELGERAALAASARELLATFDARRDAWTAKTGAAAFELARQYARVVSQGLDGLAVSAEPSWAGSKMRDVAMADNVDWLLARDPGQKIVLWAHNAHVDTSETGSSMGRLLRNRHGGDMVVFGFAFTEGGFQARDYAGTPGPLLWKVSPNPKAVFDVTMASAGLSIAALDLRAAPDTGPVHDWLDVPHGTRNIGALYRAESEFIPRVAFPESYDAVLFVERTTAAHPLPSALAQQPEAPVLEQPSNLALRAKSAGAPKDWTLRGASWGYAVTADAPAGATLRRAAASAPYGERYGSLVQKLKATPFRGARVRFRVSARAAAAPGDGNAAHVAVWIERPGKGFILSRPVLVTQPVTTDAWAPYESTVDVPADATTIAYGIVLAGDGRVSARDASFVAAP